MTITDFILARIDDDEAAIIEAPELPFTSRQMLAECEAKRRIVRDWTHAGDCGELEYEADRVGEAQDQWALESALESVVKILAAVYADHADYREEWRR